MRRKALGFYGQTIAEEFLRAKGYEILARNFCLRGGEIDLVARDGDVLVGVEVKTRRSEQFGQSNEVMLGAQARRVAGMLGTFSRMRHIKTHAQRVDLVSISLNENNGCEAIEYQKELDYE